MKKFKLKGKRLVVKHLIEICDKAKSGIIFQVRDNPHIKNKSLRMYLHEVKSWDPTEIEGAPYPMADK